MESRDPAHAAVRRGHFREASDRLKRRANASVDDSVLLAEILYQLGRTDESVHASSGLLRNASLADSAASRCTSILADDRWHAGDYEKAIALYRRALAQAESSGDIDVVCVAALRLLERTCESTGFDSSIPLARNARRFATRSPDSQIHAQAHLTFGRLEAKIGNLGPAKKHFDLVRELVRAETNLYLSAAADIDESVLLWISGDIRTATEMAERGVTTAAEIGWSKGTVAGRANLACLYVCLGRLDEAQRQISEATAEPFSSLSFRIALADTRARALIAQHSLNEARRAIDTDLVDGINQPWYDLTAEQTRIELLLLEGRWLEALEKLQQGISLARKAKIGPLLTGLQLLQIDALTQARAPERAIHLPDTYVLSTDLPVRVVGSTYAAIGTAFTRLGRTSRGRAFVSRAGRVFREAGDFTGWRSLGESPEEWSNETSSTGPTYKFSTLDAAVALLELAGHPHILGREAFELLHEAGCAEALALVAVSSSGPRVVAAHGWNQDDALQAVRRADPEDLIVLGPHRDETWQIVAQPRPELDHRCTLAAIRKLVTTARVLDHYRRDEKQRAALWPAEALDGDADSLWISEQSADLLAIARRIANAPLPVLLTGETGTGKEMLARVIHRASARASHALQPFNCTAVPREMLESQLFGYRKGAFTGADVNFPGVIRAAAGGTLFLDEIGDVGIDIQPKLLRFLEHQEIHALGEPHPVTVDVRIIAATNANLELLVAQGRFREDLLYRLNVMKLHLPPLRERREEIPPLVQHYLRKYADEQRKGAPTLSDDTLEYLLLYSWPGNIRQLANEVRRMVALSEPDATLTPSLLSAEIQASRRTIPAPSAPVEPEIHLRLDQRLPDAVDTLEQSLIRRALERSHGRVEEAAKLLGISRKGLFLKRRRWGFETAERGLRTAERR